MYYVLCNQDRHRHRSDIIAAIFTRRNRLIAEISCKGFSFRCYLFGGNEPVLRGISSVKGSNNTDIVFVLRKTAYNNY